MFNLWNADRSWSGFAGENLVQAMEIEILKRASAYFSRYDDVARRTDELVATVDLDSARPLPKAPWFEAGAGWSARRVLLRVIAETAQHAGHADFIRESLVGAKSMG